MRIHIDAWDSRITNRVFSVAGAAEAALFGLGWSYESGLYLVALGHRMALAARQAGVVRQILGIGNFAVTGAALLGR